VTTPPSDRDEAVTDHTSLLHTTVAVMRPNTPERLISRSPSRPTWLAYQNILLVYSSESTKLLQKGRPAVWVADGLTSKPNLTILYATEEQVLDRLRRLWAWSTVLRVLMLKPVRGPAPTKQGRICTLPSLWYSWVPWLRYTVLSGEEKEISRRRPVSEWRCPVFLVLCLAAE
jgi:hypothetical protein